MIHPLERARALLERTGDELRHILADLPECDTDGRDYIQQAIDMTSDAMRQIGEEDARREREANREQIEREERAERDNITGLVRWHHAGVL